MDLPVHLYTKKLQRMRELLHQTQLLWLSSMAVRVCTPFRHIGPFCQAAEVSEGFETVAPSPRR